MFLPSFTKIPLSLSYNFSSLSSFNIHVTFLLSIIKLSKLSHSSYIQSFYLLSYSIFFINRSDLTKVSFNKFLSLPQIISLNLKISIWDVFVLFFKIIFMFTLLLLRLYRMIVVVSRTYFDRYHSKNVLIWMKKKFLNYSNKLIILYSHFFARYHKYP